jgi:hypothetical protein
MVLDRSSLFIAGTTTGYSYLNNGNPFTNTQRYVAISAGYTGDVSNNFFGVKFKSSGQDLIIQSNDTSGNTVIRNTPLIVDNTITNENIQIGSTGAIIGDVSFNNMLIINPSISTGSTNNSDLTIQSSFGNVNITADTSTPIAPGATAGCVNIDASNGFFINGVQFPLASYTLAYQTNGTIKWSLQDPSGQGFSIPTGNTAILTVPLTNFSYNPNISTFFSVSFSLITLLTTPGTLPTGGNNGLSCWLTIGAVEPKIFNQSTGTTNIIIVNSINNFDETQMTCTDLINLSGATNSNIVISVRNNGGTTSSWITNATKFVLTLTQLSPNSYSSNF